MASSIEPQRKNILFITSDQQHWMAMGYLNPEVKTPNLDRLAASGTTFHRAYTVNPACTPTRASWITGLYPSQHGAYSLGTKLMENVPTIGDFLQSHNYRTALIGKAHFQPLISTEQYPSLEAYPILHDLDFWRDFNRPFYGFEHVEMARNHTDESHVGQHYALWLQAKKPNQWRQYFLPTEDSRPDNPDYPESTRRHLKPGEPWDIPEDLHYNAWIAERTNAILEQYRDQGENFMLWASFFDPHPQYMVPEPYASMYDPDKVTVPEYQAGEFEDKPPYFKLSQQENPDFTEYQEPEGNSIHGAGSHLRSRADKAKNMAAMYGMMTMLDTYIGKIIDRLEELGLRESTLVCFTSDHGDFLGQHGLTLKAIHHYEDLIKVPLVVSRPGVVPPARVSQSLQSTVDLAPTFLSMIGLDQVRTMSGVDQAPVWQGEKETVRDHLIVENQHQPTTMNLRTLVTARYKITVHYNHEYGEMYDLQNDPGEYRNLWDRPEQQSLKQ